MQLMAGILCSEFRIMGNRRVDNLNRLWNVMYNIHTFTYHLSPTLDVKHIRPSYTSTYRYNTCTANIHNTCTL